MNTELGIIIKEVCKRYGDRIGCFQIITNGSVLPSHELLLLLKENNVLVRISDYTDQVPYKERYNELLLLLEKAGIHYSISKYAEWFAMGLDKLELKFNSREEIIRHRENCSVGCHQMPKDYVAIIFSHVPPIKQLHAWSDWIRNSHILMPVLDKFADRILAYINGHSHCDHLFNDLHNGQFPIISINCAKCEYFLEHKPEGAVVPYRRLGARMQESFDIMQVDTEKREIYFTRFGAGQDRIVRNHKAEWV